MTLEPDRRSHPSIGHHGYPLARASAPKLARSGGALHLQASSQFTDSAAAAGLRALEKRVEAVPVAVYEFLQAGGVPAAVTIITSEPVHMELREAAISLLIAVARKQPQALSLAFVEAKGMEAVAHLMGQGVQLRAGALTQQGAATVAAAARLLEATLEAGVQPAARAFADAGGFAALRMGIACAQLSSQLGLEVAERALGLLHRLVWAGNKSHAGPPHAALCSAVCSARAHQPVLALVYANPHIPAAAKGVEVLRTLAAATPACMRALLQSNCVDTCLTVLDRADSNSNSKVARTAALLLHDALDWDPVCRADVLAKGGVATFLNVLMRDETDGAPIADVISGLLSALAEGSADITHQEGKLALHWAAQFGEVEILHKLNGRQSLQAVDGRGNSALHLAVAAGQMDATKLLLEAGADVRARNFAGDQPDQLAVQGTPLWDILIAELDWRACLEQPRPCQYAAAASDASCSGQEEAWQGPVDCSFLPLSGRVRIESAGIPSSSKHWLMSAIKGGRSRTAQKESQSQQPGQLLHEFQLPLQCHVASLDDLTLSLDFTDVDGTTNSTDQGRSVVSDVQQSSGGCVGRLVIRADSPPGQRAPDLARALRTLLHRCYSGATLQVDAAGSGDVSRTASIHEQGSVKESSAVDCKFIVSPCSTLDAPLHSPEAVQKPQPSSEAPSQPSTPQPDSAELWALAHGQGGLAGSSKAHQQASASYELPGDVPGRQEAAADLSSPVQEGMPRNEKPSVASIEAKPSERPVSAESAAQRRPSSALEIARRLRRAPAAGAKSGLASDAKLGSPPIGGAAKPGDSSVADVKSGAPAGVSDNLAGSVGWEQQQRAPKRAAFIQQAACRATEGNTFPSEFEEQCKQVSTPARASVQEQEQADKARNCSGSRLQEEGQQSPSKEKLASGPAARTPPLMSYLPLAESQQKGIRPKAPPPPPPPPPLLRSYGPAAVVDATATAAAVRAGDDIRRQQETLGRGKLYAPTTQSVADKVRELELQIGLVQQLNSQGLRKDEAAAETSEHVAKTGSAPVPPLPAGGPNRLLSSGGAFLPEEDMALAALSAHDKAVSQLSGGSAAGQGTARRRASMCDLREDNAMSANLSLPANQPSSGEAAGLEAAAGAPVTASDVTANITSVQQPLAVDAISAAASNAAGQAAAWEAVRRRRGKKPLSHGPRTPALKTAAPLPEASAITNDEAAASQEEHEQSGAPEPVVQQQPPVKRKPFAYGPRPASLSAAAVQKAAPAILNGIGSPATVGSPQDEEKDAAAAAQAREQTPAQQKSCPGGARAPAGVIFVSGDSPSGPRKCDSAELAIHRRKPFAYAPRSSAVSDSSSATRSDDAELGKADSASDVRVLADATVVTQRSASVRKPFAYGPRRATAAITGPSGGGGWTEVDAGGETRQGWSQDPRFNRG